MSGRPLDGVWEMPGSCLEGLEKVSETEGVFEVLKSFCH